MTEKITVQVTVRSRFVGGEVNWFESSQQLYSLPLPPSWRVGSLRL